jgi:hypothetical protein
MGKENKNNPGKMVTKGTLLPWDDCCGDPEKASLYNSEKASDRLIKLCTKIVFPEDNAQCGCNNDRPPSVAG